MKPYKVQLMQELKSHDHSMRFRFAQWAEQRLIEKMIIFTEKSSFLTKLIFTSVAM